MERGRDRGREGPGLLSPRSGGFSALWPRALGAIGAQRRLLGRGAPAPPPSGAPAGEQDLRTDRKAPAPGRGLQLRPHALIAQQGTSGKGLKGHLAFFLPLPCSSGAPVPESQFPFTSRTQAQWRIPSVPPDPPEAAWKDSKEGAGNPVEERKRCDEHSRFEKLTLFWKLYKHTFKHNTKQCIIKSEGGSLYSKCWEMLKRTWDFLKNEKGRKKIPGTKKDIGSTVNPTPCPSSNPQKEKKKARQILHRVKSSCLFEIQIYLGILYLYLLNLAIITKKNTLLKKP